MEILHMRCTLQKKTNEYIIWIEHSGGVARWNRNLQLNKIDRVAGELDDNRLGWYNTHGTPITSHVYMNPKTQRQTIENSAETCGLIDVVDP